MLELSSQQYWLLVNTMIDKAPINISHDPCFCFGTSKLYEITPIAKREVWGNLPPPLSRREDQYFTIGLHWAYISKAGVMDCFSSIRLNIVYYKCRKSLKYLNCRRSYTDEIRRFAFCVDTLLMNMLKFR